MSPPLSTSEPALSAESQARVMIDAWAEAIRAKDVAGVIACQAEDCVQFEVPPPLRVVGPDPEALRAWFATWRDRIGFKIAELRLSAREDLAFACCLIHLSGERTDGSATAIWIRNTLCLRQTGGSWKIAHLHESVPVRMDGGLQGAVDLAP